MTTPLSFLWLRVDAHKFRGHTPELLSGLQIILFLTGVLFSVSNLSPSEQPYGLSRHEAKHRAELSHLIPSLPRAGVEPCLEESPTEEQTGPGPAPSFRKRKPKESPGSSLLSSPRGSSAGQRLCPAELPKPWPDAWQRLSPPAKPQLPGCVFSWPNWLLEVSYLEGLKACGQPQGAVSCRGRSPVRLWVTPTACYLLSK